LFWHELAPVEFLGGRLGVTSSSPQDTNVGQMIASTFTTYVRRSCA